MMSKSLEFNYAGFMITVVMLLLIASCSTANKIRNGQMAYDQKQYSVAVDMLVNEFENTRNKQEQARTAYMIGDSYSKMGETDESVMWLETAYSKGYGLEATQALAYGYKKQGKYKSAISKFEALMTQVVGRSQEIKREISVLEQVALWKAPEKYKYNVQIARQSGKDMDYAATIFEDDYLVFTSDREGSTGKKIYNWTGAYHSDLYIVNKNGNNAKKFDAIINSEHNDGAACFTKDYQEIYFTRCYSPDDVLDAHCKIMYSNRFNEVWTEPMPLNFTVDGINYGQPALIEEDSVLIFSANLGGTIGGHDLFYTQRVDDGDGLPIWSKPEPMPPTINTPGEEMFPVGDGDTLYYSSDYLPGYGGLDIFKTYLRENGTWSPPQNLRAPINSSEDDYSFIVDYNANRRKGSLQKGYFTSSRKGYGYDDIYKFEKIRVIPEKDTVELDNPIDKSKYIMTLAIQTRKPDYYVQENPNSGVKGFSKLSNVKIEVSSGDDRETYSSDGNGLLLIPVEEGKIYTIKGSKLSYLNVKEKLSTKDVSYNEDKLSITFNKTLTLDKIFYDTEIVLDNIYYDLNKWQIRKDAELVLDSLSSLLIDNPQIEIELSSHTDCRSDDEYNVILSQKRAQAAVDYILTKGVRSSAITARGYGETALIDTCECNSCTEEQHQKNRRTSFKILE